MLKAFKKDILLAMKQGQKFQKQTMGISLQYVIIVVKNITLKNLLSQKEEVRWLCFNCHRKWHKEHDNPELIGGEANG